MQPNHTDVVPPMSFDWWDDAVALANDLARGTLIRHSVKAWCGAWVVAPEFDVVFGAAG